MREFIEKYRNIEKEVASEKGDFVLFALVERDGSGGRWDLVASATWFGENKAPALDYIARKVQSVLSNDELLSLSRIVLLDPTEIFVRALIAEAKREGTHELRDLDFQGMFLIRAYVVTPQPDGRPAEENPSSQGTDRGPATTARQTAARVESGGTGRVRL